MRAFPRTPKQNLKPAQSGLRTTEEISPGGDNFSTHVSRGFASPTFQRSQLPPRSRSQSHASAETLLSYFLNSFGVSLYRIAPLISHIHLAESSFFSSATEVVPSLTQFFRDNGREALRPFFCKEGQQIGRSLDGIDVAVDDSPSSGVWPTDLTGGAAAPEEARKDSLCTSSVIYLRYSLQLTKIVL